MVTAAIGRAQGISEAGPAAALGVDPAMEKHLFCCPRGPIREIRGVAHPLVKPGVVAIAAGLQHRIG
jgi:hypothetical protein